MKRQKAEIRIIVLDGERVGLYWQANCEGKDFYYGPPHTPLGPILRGSYHESGVSHIHLPQGKKVGRIKLTPPGSLTDLIRVLEQGTRSEDIKWGYKIKEKKNRTNIVIDITKEDKKWLPSVEFWIVPQGQNTVMEEMVTKRKSYGDRLVGKTFVGTTSPQSLALVWLPSQSMKEAFEKSFSKKSD